MTTNFKGVRIRKPRTPIVSDNSIFMNLVGDLDSISTDDVDLSKQRFISSSVSDEKLSKYVIYGVRENPGIKRKVNSPAKYYVIKEIRDILYATGIKFFNENQNKEYVDTITITELSKIYGVDSSNTHIEHKTGTDADIRLISTDGEGATINTNNYSYEGTRELIKTLINVTENYVSEEHPDSKVTLEKIIFNDSRIVNDFDIVRSGKGHDNHLHVSWNIPTRILEAENLSGKNTTNTSEGEGFEGKPLIKIPRESRPSIDDRIAALGKI